MDRPRCARCALPTLVPTVAHGDSVTGPSEAPCPACGQDLPPWHKAWAWTDYAAPWDRLIGDFKFRQQPGLATWFAARLLALNGASQALRASDLVVPVPLAPARLRERGFNQAALLARALAPTKVQTGALVRSLDTPAQAGLDRTARARNLIDAFALRARSIDRVRGAHVTLVDDVLTTGATLASATRVLLAAGARQVSVIVMARTPAPARAANTPHID